MDLTLDQLLVLRTVVQTGSFAAAAKELHRVPSAVSYTVKGLEEALGLELFDRSGRTAVLTENGRRVLEAGEQALEAATAVERLAGQLRGGWEPELRVVVDGILPMAPITRCLRAFADPDIPTRVRLDVEYRHGVIDRFEADRAHLMLILGFQGDGDERGYDSRPLPDLEMVLAVASDHPLAAVPEPKREDLRPYLELVVRDSSPRLARSPRESFFGTRDVVTLSDFHSKRLALLGGAGFGWVPRHLVAADLHEGRLRLLPVDGRATWTYHPAVVTRQGEPLGRAGRLFVEVLEQYVKSTDD